MKILTTHCTIAGAAKLVGVPESSIRSAIRTGYLIPETTACKSIQLLRVKHVERWAANRPKRGRGSKKFGKT